MELKPLETKLKSDIFLQVIVFGLTAALVSLLAVKVYPKNLINPKKPNPTPPPQVLTSKTDQAEALPSSITIPALEISLPISPGIIADNQWTLYDDRVSWLATSEVPGNGNVILYAHNRAGLFGALEDLAVGEKIEVSSTGGKKYIYLVKEKRKILPTDVDAVISAQNQLTLYTCNGSFDEKRLIVTAIPLTGQLSGAIL